MSSKEVGGGPAAMVALVAAGMSAASVTSCVGGCIAVCPRMNTGANLYPSSCLVILTAATVDGGAG